MENNILGIPDFGDSKIIMSQCFLLGCRQPHFLKAGTEISIVIGRFLETKVVLPEHALHQLLDYT